jgi:hypothetical protein
MLTVPLTTVLQNRQVFVPDPVHGTSLFVHIDIANRCHTKRKEMSWGEGW